MGGSRRGGWFVIMEGGHAAYSASQKKAPPERGLFVEGFQFGYRMTRLSTFVASDASSKALLRYFRISGVSERYPYSRITV